MNESILVNEFSVGIDVVTIPPMNANGNLMLSDDIWEFCFTPRIASRHIPDFLIDIVEKPCRGRS